MMRDPRDILVSKHQWYNAREYWVYPTRQCAEARGASEKHARFGLLEYLSALRNLVGTRNTSSSDIMYGASYEILRYEDLLSGEIQIPEILERMGISVNADRYSLNTGLPYDLSERATQPLEKRSSTWSSGDDRAKVLLDFGLYPELHDYMKFFGYEENDAWYQALANENEIFWQNNR